MSKAARAQELIGAVCEEFGVERAELSEKRGQGTSSNLRQARAACALLAGAAAGLPVAAMGRLIGYQGKYFWHLGRQARTWLRWANWPEPPQKSGAVNFRRKIGRICQRWEVDIEELAQEP